MIIVISAEVHLKKIQVNIMNRMESMSQNFLRILEAVRRSNIFLIHNSFIETNKMTRTTK